MIARKDNLHNRKYGYEKALEFLEKQGRKDRYDYFGSIANYDIKLEKLEGFSYIFKDKKDPEHDLYLWYSFDDDRVTHYGEDEIIEDDLYE